MVGVYADLMRDAAKSAGYELELKPVPWERCLKLTINLYRMMMSGSGSAVVAGVAADVILEKDLTNNPTPAKPNNKEQNSELVAH